MSALLGRASEGGATWDGLRDDADCQGWGRLGAPLTQLAPTLRVLAEAIDLGASVEITASGGRVARRVGLIDESQRATVLDEAERMALFAAWVAPVGG